MEKQTEHEGKGQPVTKKREALSKSSNMTEKTSRAVGGAVGANDGESVFECGSCGSVFRSATGLSCHFQTVHEMVCAMCQAKFNSRTQLISHILSTHNMLVIACSRCSKLFDDIVACRKHAQDCATKSASKPDDTGPSWKGKEEAQNPRKVLNVHCATV